jgi:hypothetical protein
LTVEADPLGMHFWPGRHSSSTSGTWGRSGTTKSAWGDPAAADCREVGKDRLHANVASGRR